MSHRGRPRERINLQAEDVGLGFRKQNNYIVFYLNFQLKTCKNGTISLLFNNYLFRFWWTGTGRDDLHEACQRAVVGIVIM